MNGAGNGGDCRGNDQPLFLDEPREGKCLSWPCAQGSWFVVGEGAVAGQELRAMREKGMVGEEKGRIRWLCLAPGEGEEKKSKGGALAASLEKMGLGLGFVFFLSRGAAPHLLDFFLFNRNRPNKASSLNFFSPPGFVYQKHIKNMGQKLDSNR